ncbi:MAG TPA: hypothetical protein EYQ11_00785 [Candidatus Poseidoniales archaeon]|nr:MAG: hypothetical protein CXT66_02475 [Euryarchaeota archaeon]HIG33404.1 hypothetical protein [Candidatus Poseidoniales archaeon]HIL67224.1 hypothetical protein [Candidatus Poseidoniales archaeon]
MSKRLTFLVCLTMAAASIALPANVVADSDDIIVESELTWGQSMTLSNNVRVVNGGILNLETSDGEISEFSIDIGVEIFVDKDSRINVRDSKVVSLQPPSELVGFGYCDEDNRSAIYIPWNQPNRGFEVTLYPVDGATLDGVTAYFGNDSKEISDDDNAIGFPSGTEGVWIDLVGPVCYPVSLSLVSVSRDGGGNNQNVYLAADLEHRNMMIHGNPGFSMNIEGSGSFIGSSIIGGEITTSGSVSFEGTKLNRVGPILLTSDNASIALSNGVDFSNSTDDHDIRARAHSSIEWGELVSGSGGLTDKWERRLSEQSLSFDAMFVTYEITGMHKFPSYSNFSNEMGVSFIDGGRERVIEIAWSEDNTWEENPVWSEQAIVTITDYRTAWNPEESGIGDYGGGQFELVWDSEVMVESETPMVGWDDLRVVGEEGLLSESPVRDSVNVEAVIVNSGTAAASLAINCEDVSTDTTAQISPSFPNAILGPGEQVTISFSWRVSVAGENSISCRILTPTQLVDELSFGGGQMSSQSVNWTVVNDEDDSALLPALIALAIATAVGGYLLFSIYNEREESTEE